MTVDLAQTPQQLVQDVLLGGGVVVNNITFSGTAGGANSQAGYFYGNTNIGFPSGVVISTGRATDAAGPNNSGSISTSLFGGSDALLNSIVAPLGTEDAFVLEFDFIPTENEVKFDYAFGSDEYMEYANSQFNDVFGFFISGPGFPVPTNIALLPSTSTVVSINNVNAVNNSGFYVDNENPAGQTVQYDGFTRVLTAQATVVPCDTYHIKIAIADVGDGAFDSAVFLKEGSFTSGSVTLSAVPSFSGSLNDTSLYEGCGSARILFKRTGDLSNPFTVNFTVDGTATNGSDYTISANSVTFPAGSNIASVDVFTLFDNFSENPETITITPQITFACQNIPVPSLTLSISDQPPLDVTVTPPFTIPCPEPVTLEAFQFGGLPDYTFQWTDSTGAILSTANTLTVTPFQTTQYFVTLTDGCGTQIARDTAKVTIPDYQPMQFVVPDPTICKRDTAELFVLVSGGKSPYTYVWLHDTLNTTNTSNVTPENPSYYYAEVTDLCGIIDTARIRVNVVGPLADFTTSQTGPRDFVFLNNSQDALYHYWNFGDGDTAVSYNSGHTYADSGYYTVLLTVQNREGCYDTATAIIRAYPDLNIYIPNAFTPNDDGVNDRFYCKGEGYATSKLTIFNRLGEEVYMAKHPAHAWNGLDREGNPITGTFSYIFEFTTPFGASHKRVGHVTVVR